MGDGSGEKEDVFGQEKLAIEIRPSGYLSRTRIYM